jgi:KDO2-lipid IV(A) lauroyltransferase
VANALATVGSRAAMTAAPGRRAQVERNLRRVYGPSFRDAELRKAVAATFASYGRYWVESFRLPGTPPSVLAERMTCDGLENLDDAMEAGTGAILAMPHLGGWEWAGFWVSSVLEYRLSVVVEPLEPVELFDWFVDLRQSFGMNVIALGPHAAGDVARALKDNHVVALLCDRDLGGNGIEVDFFGERTTLPAGPATLALRSGAPLLPTAAYFDGPNHRGLVGAPMDATRSGRLRDDVARVTQDLAGELEFLIRKAPEQWHLMQANWPSDPGYASPEVP